MKKPLQDSSLRGCIDQRGGLTFNRYTRELLSRGDRGC